MIDWLIDWLIDCSTSALSTYTVAKESKPGYYCNNFVYCQEEEEDGE